jgi:DNA-binding transcriptional regulator YhcF (GntR family)
MQRNTPARERAEDFMDHLLQRPHQKGNGELPTIRELAAMAGVSYVVMWTVVSGLREKGVLNVKPGWGTSLAVTKENSNDVPVAVHYKPHKRVLKWDALRMTIEQEVLKGRHVPGADLPTAKELVQTHGVCAATLHKALSALASQQIIQRHGNGFRVPLLSSRHSQASVVLIAAGDTSGNLLYLQGRTDDHMRYLERECSQAQIRLTILPFSYEDTSGPSPSLRSGYPGGFPALRQHASALGFVIWTPGIGAADLEDIVSHLCRLGKPIAILDEKGDARGLSADPAVKIFSMGLSPTSGFEVGRFLLGQRHRRIAYMTPEIPGMPDTYRSKRQQGLERAFCRAGLPDAVHAFYVEENGGDALGEGAPAEPATEVVNDLNRWIRQRDRRYAAFTPAAAERIWNTVANALRAEASFGRLAPLFDKALADPEITAWVAFNDEYAVRALEHLYYRKRSVPQDISVIGFDDTSAASFHKLTSYNFNSSAVTHAMLAYILSPRASRWRRDTSEPVEIPGIITVRSTTSKARHR